MFDDEDVRHQPLRRKNPPVDVLVDVAQLFAPRRVRWGKQTPVWARASGLDVSKPVPGKMHGWVVMSVGDWYADVEFVLKARNSGLRFPLRQLVPADFVREAPPAE